MKQDVRRNNALLDLVIELQGLKNDARLSHALETSSCLISNVRAGRREIGNTMLLAIHEYAGITFPVLRQYVPRRS